MPSKSSPRAAILPSKLQVSVWHNQKYENTAGGCVQGMQAINLPVLVKIVKDRGSHQGEWYSASEANVDPTEVLLLRVDERGGTVSSLFPGHAYKAILSKKGRPADCCLKYNQKLSS